MTTFQLFTFIVLPGIVILGAYALTLLHERSSPAYLQSSRTSIPISFSPWSLTQVAILIVLLANLVLEFRSHHSWIGSLNRLFEGFQGPGTGVAGEQQVSPPKSPTITPN